MDGLSSHAPRAMGPRANLAACMHRAINDDQRMQQDAICCQWSKQQLILSVFKPMIGQQSKRTLCACPRYYYLNMHLVDLHAPTSCRAQIWTPDVGGLAATQAMRTAAQWFVPLHHKGRLICRLKLSTIFTSMHEEPVLWPTLLDISCTLIPQFCLLHNIFNSMTVFCAHCFGWTSMEAHLEGFFCLDKI